MRKGLFSALALFSFVAAAWASDTGSISGVVKDPNGAVVPDVAVKAVNTATGVERSVTTNAEGFYALPDLPIGIYDVTFHKEGFEDYRQTGVTVDVTASISVNATLQVGTVKQEVTVSSTAVHVDTQRTEMGEVITGSHMTAMPLNGRAYTDLLALQPGVIPVSTGEYSTYQSPSGELNAGNLSVSGQREDANGFMVNGGNVEEPGTNGTAVIPNLDSIAEFRIQTNNFDPEYGNYSGGLVNVVTKSGTNQFHGDLFEFLRNSNMDARNFYSYDQTNPFTGAEIPGSARAELHRNQFGGTIGGPIKRDKVFFFGDYQGTREVQGQPTGLIPVPSSADRPSGNGVTLSDLSSSLTGTVSGPYWAGTLSSALGYTVNAGEPYYFAGNLNPVTGSTQTCATAADAAAGNCVFPTAVIPQSVISGPARTILNGKYIPEPNITISQGTFFDSSAYKQTIHDDKWSYRTDVNTRWGMLSGYYFFDDFSRLNPFGGGNLPGFSALGGGRSQQLNLSDTKSIGSAMVNEFRANYLRYAFSSDDAKGGVGPSLSSFGITNVVSVTPSQEGVPNVTTNEFEFGVDPWITRQVNNAYQMIDNFSKVYGTHAMKFGGEYHYLQSDLFAPDGGNGLWNFFGSETGSDYADFLLGAVSSYAQGQAYPQYTRANYYSLYAQDSWRARANLTLNYGLRWEVSTPWWEKYNELETYALGVQSLALPGAPTGYLIPTDPTVPRTVAPIRYANFAPRLAFAYSPSGDQGIQRWLFGGPGHSSLRAGYGIFYTTFEDRNTFNTIGDQPFGEFYVSPSETTFANPFINLADGVDNGQRFPSPAPPLDISASHPDTTLTAADWARLFFPLGGPGFDHTNRLPYAESYMVSFERQVSPNTLLSLSYVGTQGHRLIGAHTINVGNPALCLSLSQTSQVASFSGTCGPFGEDGTYTRADGAVFYGTRGPFSGHGPVGPAFSGSQLFSTMANSNYNAFEASLRRTTGGLTWLAGYTYSKAMDNTSSWGPGSGEGGNEQINPINPKLSKSLSAFDITHNFVASFNYELPFAKFLPPNRATQGWKLTGITHYATGFPVFITEQDDNSLLGVFGSGTGHAIDTPNFTPGKILADTNPRHGNAYFNTSLFSPEQLGQLGTSNRRFFHGPGIDTWDLGIMKDLRLTESKSLEFRGEFFGVFNHANFGNPGGDITDTSTFGFVTGAGGERIGQVALKLYF